ncbi:phosphopantetheine-binding protein [Cesiribacter sp. SM1]|uniref:phosphopantetheine-binding protein n=1 Tax=Cesiribacter sp. SM1 TaxID=2861196 RepID=UPI001CD1A05E|nr:phosphopantetheine-binding protein [Cesiribacter sp. SM1]
MEYTYPTIVATVTRMISKNKGVRKSAILVKDNLRELGLDQLDVVDLILEVEKKYHITIPDEVPVETVTDIARFVYTHAAA